MSDSTPAPTPESVRSHVELFLPALRETVDAVEALVDPIAWAFRQLDGPLSVEGDEEAERLAAYTRLDEANDLLIRIEMCVAVITGNGNFWKEQLVGIPDPAAVGRHLEHREQPFKNATAAEHKGCA